MKKILFISSIIILGSIISSAQNNLTIKINTLRNSNGKIYLYFFDKEQNIIIERSSVIENNECHMTLEDLNSDQYAFKYFHDENDNGKLDCNWLGIPNEGYGFSNNAVGTYGPPSFEEWIFEINDHKNLICYPKYHN